MDRNSGFKVDADGNLNLNINSFRGRRAHTTYTAHSTLHHAWLAPTACVRVPVAVDDEDPPCCTLVVRVGDRDGFYGLLPLVEMSTVKNNGF